MGIECSETEIRENGRLINWGRMGKRGEDR